MRRNTATGTVFRTLRALARGWKWYTFRKAHLKREPFCQWCLGRDKLEVHHITPLSQGGPEFSESNVITLCDPDHFRHGHFGNWQKHNAAIRSQCSMRNRSYYEAR